jgi:hypothetical protein
MKNRCGKKKTRILLVAVLAALLFALSSCSSISNLVRSSVEGVPSWVYSPEAKVNQLVFVGKGNGKVMFNARLIAYEDIVSQLTTFLGEELNQDYYRELTTTDAIVDLGLKITHEYEKVDQSGSNAYLMASADSAKLISKRTTIFNAILERDTAISNLISKAESSYRANKDLEAINLYLEAVQIASSGIVSEERFGVEALLEQAQFLISSLRFSITKSDSSKATCTVFLRRKSRLLSPKVLSAPIKATFSARNSLGRNYTDTLLFNTADNGFVTFIPYNQGIAGSGTIIFSVDFSQSLARLQDSLTAEQMQGLEASIDENQVSFSYSLVSPLQTGGILANIKEYTFGGELRTSQVSTSSMCSEFSIDSIFVEPTPVVATEVNDLVSEVKKLNKKERYFLLGRAGVVDEQLLGEKFSAVVTGSVQLWNLSTGKILGDTLEIEAVAFNADLDKAKDEAFRRFGMIASYLLSQYLF